MKRLLLISLLSCPMVPSYLTPQTPTTVNQELTKHKEESTQPQTQMISPETQEYLKKTATYGGIAIGTMAVFYLAVRIYVGYYDE